MANKLFKSFFAVAMVLGATLGFVACETPEEEVVGDPSVEVSVKSAEAVRVGREAKVDAKHRLVEALGSVLGNSF